MQPVGDIGRLLAQRAPHVLLHTDAAQSVAKLDLDVGRLNVQDSGDDTSDDETADDDSDSDIEHVVDVCRVCLQVGGTVRTNGQPRQMGSYDIYFEVR